MTEEPTKPKSSNSIWIIIARIVVIICFGGLGFVLGVVLWVVGINTPLIDYNMNYDSILVTLLPVSSIPTVLGGFIGYRISRSIK